ncbi:hypothetical protein NIES4071_94100 [Calothrix sp. NIES-4071]|nr:hypothetical protein NIES4071_94100 [Calothrix sp. NIES-4071]BAZ63675.1 hypothetical protein NIES4105_94030 [Calothrix sp. NIES-4105]
MTKLVILNFGKGDFRQGFSTVTVQLWEETNVPIQMVGSLPATPEISDLYRRWQLLYCLLHEALYQDTSWRRFRNDFQYDSDVEVEEEDITNVSLIEFGSLCKQLQHHINLWFKSLSFIYVTQKLRTKLAPLDEIKFIFETENEEVRKIPWHLWDFFEDYINAVACLSSREFEYIKPVATRNRPMRILAILGNSEGIDIQKDRAILELTNAQTKFLVEPQRRELDYWLWDKQGWDIIFFAGHSYSQLNGDTGTIQINKTDSLTILQLKNGLQAALSNGLSLAIFNSCDGLGLARDLASLHIPQIIVMREPVPDVIAQAFLKNFIEAFATGKSLYMSVREAQARLQGLEDEYPCASWLPVICQNPAAAPLIWRTNRIAHNSHLPNSFLFSTLVQVSLLISAFIIGARATGIMESWELSAFDQIMRIRPAEQPDNRIVVITVTEADVQAQSPQERQGMSLSDRTLTSVMEKIQHFNPRVIGLDIYRENPVQDNFKNLAKVMQSDNFVTVCKGGEDSADPGVPPPPEVTPSNIGFSDVVPDPDTILRRQLLAMAPPVAPEARCKTDKSFSFQVARRYLATENIRSNLTWDKNLEIGNKVFKNLRSDSGGYHNIDSRGHQVLLNWRAGTPYIKQLTVQYVLDNKLSGDLVKDKIVLIGTTADSFNDLRWSTPYTKGKWPHSQVAGVVVQAHMVSQIVSAVLNNRPLLNVLPKWSEYLWIWSWSLVGATIALNISETRRLILATIISCGVLYGICVYVLILGVWAPLVPSTLVLLLSTAGLRLYVQSKQQIK